MLRRLALLLSATTALALSGVASPAHAEENGLKVGDGRLHPYFDLESVYDTAAQLELNPPPNNTTASGVGDLILHFRPGVKLDIPSPYVALTLGAAGEYLVYTGLNSNTASKLDRFQGEANVDVGFLRGSVVSFDLGDHFTRSDQTTNVGSPVGLLSFYNDARFGLTIAPGGGSLTISPGYHLMVETFSDLLQLQNAPPSDVGSDNYLQHRITLENRWRFLPKTAVMLDGEYNLRGYTGTGSTNINYFKASTGLTGLVTPHLSTVLRLGWAMDLSSSSFSSLIGQLEGTYLPNETTQLRLGFLRNFEPVAAPFVSYEDDRGYLQGRLTVLSRLTLNAQVSADYLGFRGGGNVRNDLQFTAGLGADYEVARWFIVGVGDMFSTRSSDVTASATNAGLNLSSDQVYLRLTFTY